MDKQHKIIIAASFAFLTIAGIAILNKSNKPKALIPNNPASDDQGNSGMMSNGMNQDAGLMAPGNNLPPLGYYPGQITAQMKANFVIQYTLSNYI